MCQLPHFAGFISSIAFVPRPRPSSSWPSSPCCAAAASGPCAASRNFSGAAWRRRCMAGCTMSSCERRDAMDDGEINNQLGVNFLCSFQLVYAANQASTWRTIPGFKSSLNLADNPRVFKFPIRKKTHHAQDAMDEMRLWSRDGIHGDPSSTAEVGGGSGRCIPACLYHIV